MSSKTKPNKTDVFGEIKQLEKQVIYTWSIDDFDDIRKQYSQEKVIWSPVIYTDSESQWQWRLHPQGQKDDGKECISIYTFYLSEASITARITYFVMDGSEEICLVRPEFREYNENNNWGLKNCSNAKLVANNKFIIKCKIEHGNKTCVETQRNEEQINFRIHEYNDFEKLLDNNEFSDVILTTGDEKIHAHKNILAIKSEVFAAMFKHDMTEKEQNIVEIKDISSNVLKEMLRYIYVGKVNNIINIATDLLVAADKYLLENLRNMCEDILCDDLSSSTAIKYLEFADNHNAFKLKTRAIQYIVSNAENIIDDPEFQSYENLDSSVKREIFRKLVTQRVEKKAK